MVESLRRRRGRIKLALVLGDNTLTNLDRVADTELIRATQQKRLIASIAAVVILVASIPMPDVINLLMVLVGVAMATVAIVLQARVNVLIGRVATKEVEYREASG